MSDRDGPDDSPADTSSDRSMPASAAPADAATTPERADSRDAVASHLGPCLAVLTTDGRIVDASASVTGALGLDPVVAAGEADFYEAVAAAAVESHASLGPDPPAERASGHVTVPTADGERVYRHVGVEGPDGHPAERVEVFEDVTRARERIEHRELLDTAAAHARDGLVATDAGGQILTCNPAFAEALGADPEGLAGTPFDALLAPDECEAWESLLADSDPGTTETCAFRFRGDGEPVRLSVDLTARPEGGVLAAVSRRPGEASHARRLDQYRTLVERASDPMWVLDADDRVTLCNQALGARFDAPASDLEGVAVQDCVPTDAAERLDDALAAVRDPDRNRWHDIELVLPGPAGEERRFAVTLGPAGEGDRVVGTARDVTERERRRAELEHLERVLGGAVRHTVADGAASLRALATRLGEYLDGRPATLADTVAARADALETLTAKSAAIERLVATDPDPVATDLDALVSAAVDAVADEAADATVTVDVPSVTVWAVPVLDIAVRNLVENALEHGGDDPQVRVTASVADRSVTLTVADDGPGIDDAELAALERGVETPLEHGSGVGLWLVDWAVAKSGGALSFATDDGTRVSVRLDRAESWSAGQFGDRAADPDFDLRVLHVDPDRTATARIRDAAAESDATVAVERPADEATASETLAEGQVDCLVLSRLDGTRAPLLDAAAEADVPVVCFTGADYGGFDEARLAAVDSVVEKGTGTAPATFLVEKVLAIAAPRATEPSNEAPETATAASPETDGSGADTSSHADTSAHADTEAPEARPEPATAAAIGLGDGTARVTRAVDAPAEFAAALRADDGRGDAGADTNEAVSGNSSASTGGDGPASIRALTVDGARRVVGRWRIDVTDEHTVTYARDLTPAVAREQRISLLTDLLDLTDDRISVVDANGRVQYHNEAFADLLGYEDMVGAHASSYLAPGELEAGQLAVQRLLESPDLDSEVLDLTMETADGDTVTLAVHYAVRADEGEYAGVVNVGRDQVATDRRLEQYRTLVECAGDPMFVAEADGQFALVNEALERQVGRPRSALVGTPVSAVFRTAEAPPPERWVDEGVNSPVELRFRDESGDRRRYEATVSDSPVVDGVVCACRDVTERERRRAELALLRQVLGRVLRHDLRNELTVVTGHAKLIADRLAGAESAREDPLADAGGGTSLPPDGDRGAGSVPDDPMALTRSIRRLSDELAATAATARAAEAVFDGDHESRPKSVRTAVESAVKAVDERSRTLSVRTAVPSGLGAAVPSTFGPALEALVRALGRRCTDATPTIQVDAHQVGDRVQIDVSVPAGAVDRHALEAFLATPDAALDSHRDAAVWVFASVVTASNASVRLDVGDGRAAVVVDLPAVPNSAAD